MADLERRRQRASLVARRAGALLPRRCRSPRRGPGSRRVRVRGHGAATAVRCHRPGSGPFPSELRSVAGRSLVLLRRVPLTGAGRALAAVGVGGQLVRGRPSPPAAVSQYVSPAPAVACLATLLVAVSARAQTRPLPAADPSVATAPRPIPGPVYESAAFSRAVARGTRTRSGVPGSAYWVQHAPYTIAATLDPARARLDGRETVLYLNRSPDALRQIAVHLRQNVFAAGSPRRDPAPITGGVTLGRVTVNGRGVPAAAAPNPAQPVTAPPRLGPAPAQYTVAGTLMYISLRTPLAPGDSLALGVT